MPCILILFVIHFCTRCDFFFCAFWYTNVFSSDTDIKTEVAFTPCFMKSKLVMPLSYFFLSTKQFSKLLNHSHVAKPEKDDCFLSMKRIIRTREDIQILRLDPDPSAHISEGVFTLLKLIPCSCHYLPQKAFLYFNISYISYSVLLIKFYL